MLSWLLMGSSNRVVIVSNRLPVTAQMAGGRVHLGRASGGLATGLRPYHEGSNGLWIGWPGDVSQWTAEQRADLEGQLHSRHIVPVWLSTDDVERYYHGFANRVLWPLFHYLIDRVPVDAVGWDAYRQVNDRFADAVAREYRSGDTIWVHDYQLMLLPALLRDRLPSARIGFFLHIPFPSSELFRVLPWRSEILAGLVGADLLGFHTFAYLRHFLASLLHVDGVESDIDHVRIDGREVQLGVFPMGVDAAEFSQVAELPAVQAKVDALKRDAGERRILLAVDRLDYTKGIPRRLQAIERLLDQHPGLRDQIRYIQVAVPSRGGVDSYQRFKRQVEETVGRLNGKWGTLGSTPVHYIHRHVSQDELVALFRAADAMLVTPLRDGMNLVAKEFVASRVDDGGVLVLSEFAGAAAELDGALTINPYDVDAMAAAFHRALSMSIDERQARMRRLRSRVQEHDVHAWASGFLSRLTAARPCATDKSGARPEPAISSLVSAALEGRPIRLLVDYDGTLVPIARSPELAAPDDEVLSLLASLASVQRFRLEIVSGRPRTTLDRWFGHLSVGLSAEHGFWYRSCPGCAWEAISDVPVDSLRRIERILEQFVDETPGTHVEKKTASVAWHYRGAAREFGARQAHELRMLLGDVLSNQPFEVIEGKKTIEVRLRGVSKALAARRAVTECEPNALLVAIGDDRTDNDLFRALPPSSITIAVGARPAVARFRLRDYRDVRRLLRSIAPERNSECVSRPRRECSAGGAVLV
jgi:trehalose 6-phosphate synthase/phosphatase